MENEAQNSLADRAKSPRPALPTFEQMKAFLMERYKSDRLYSSPSVHDFPDYGDTVVQSHLDDLQRYGFDTISECEALNGRTTFVRFTNGELREVSWEETACPSDVAGVESEGEKGSR